MNPLRKPGGIGQRTLLIFVVPLLLAVAALGYRFTSLQLDEAQSVLHERGELVVRQLAVISEFGVFSEDIGELNRQAASIYQETDAIHITIENIAGELLAEAGGIPDYLDTSQVITLSAPVMRSSVEVSDYADEHSEPSATDPDAPIGLVQVSFSTLPLEQRRDNILLTGILLTGSGLIISFLFALLVARSVSAPIIRLTGTVSKLTGGNLSARARTGSPGELGALEQGINQMAGSLEHAQRQLLHEVEEATAALQKSVHELEARNRELDMARQEALRAGQAKSDFLARMSHEIRTPLSAVIGFSRLLDNTKLSETQTEYVRTISQAASQLLVVIDDILGYTRIESATLHVEHIRFDLHDCLENVVSILSTAAHQKQLELVLYIHSDVPHRFTGDPNRISQVITNLLSNAIKFTEHGHVIMEVAVLDADDNSITVNFTVTDTGIGIAGEQLEHIFDPFIQADATTSRRFGGTGLGLSISKKLVELMGGEISADSTPGQGSSFSFSLASPILADAAEAPPARILTGKRVLIHDTNPFALRAVRNRFFTWGANVFYTPSRKRMLDMISPQARQQQSYALLVIGLAATEHSKQAIDDMLALVRARTAIPLLMLVNGEIHSLFGADGSLPDTCLLAKPPRGDRILRAVRELLELEPEVPATPLPAPVPVRTELDGLQVLLAEDNSFNQQLLARMLSDLGVQVTLAANGSEACTLADSIRFDAILMDIHMPVMGGIRATQHIRRGINRDTPVIALTADVFADQDRYLGALGFSDCLYKPVAPSQLAAALAQRSQNDAGHTRATRVAREEPVPLDAGLRERLQEELQIRLRTLRQALHGNDQAAAREQLHLLKGMVDYFGISHFGTTFRSLRKALHEGNTGQAGDLLDRLEAMLRDPRDGDAR